MLRRARRGYATRSYLSVRPSLFLSPLRLSVCPTLTFRYRGQWLEFLENTCTFTAELVP